jgi:prolipoprotein diacylglyceryltransferase
MQVLDQAYPSLVLFVGGLASIGALLTGCVCALVFVTTPNNTGDMIERALLGAISLVFGCLVCICCLAFTKWAVGP